MPYYHVLLSDFVEQKKVASPKIELVEYGNTTDCKIAIAVLSNNTISLSNVKAAGENLFVISDGKAYCTTRE